MPRDGEDDDWDSFDENAATTADDVQQAIPEATTPQPDTTGRHRTLQGYVDREREIAQARTEQHDYDMMALKLAMMEGGTHPDVAEAQVTRLRLWCSVPENDHLVRVALRRA